ncbi:MAG TPA: hypothetical protein VH559_00840 [Gemmatimonadaceae bacterium]
MRIAVQLGPAPENGSPSEVEYKWDSDTDILSAQLSPGHPSQGMSGSVGLEGSDGSWLVLDVSSGRISGVEIAVWPEVRKLATLAPPAQIEEAKVVIPARQSQPNIASMETVTRLIADSDPAQRNFHFRLGKPRATRTIRLARDVLLDIDEKSQISGLWLLNVPPGPAPSEL